ncbi:MAG: ASKHA domain-containing protein [Clostridiales Family XIII bacterium]|jgi:uncharacterized 2Fe-2S/4Fe-4S cluster protein (DUF4445 family)|nr:ASKHA domain-containing protein [Clostridiales Family XIII bacterium]
MSRVSFVGKNVVLDVPAGTTILEAARRAGIRIESPCNGEGKCGKCRIYVEQLEPAGAVLIPAGETGQNAAAGEAGVNDYVLACLSCIDGDLKIHLDDAERESVRILSEGRGFSHEISPPVRKEYDAAEGLTRVFVGDERFSEPGDSSGEAYGVVADIGTTTLVAALIDLASGRELASESALNPQTEHAQDVLSRVKIASEPEGLDTLYRGISRELNRMIAELSQRAGVDREHIYEVVFSGNTCMLHLAVGVSPEPIGMYPYTPALMGACYEPASRHGLRVSPFGRIYLPPVISAYVGADISSGILASRLFDRRGTTLFMDIGTNGEMVISRDGELSATSTAAGPAFEGMNIESGMRAAAGAIELVEIDGEGRVSLGTVEGAPPVGICGSGLLDAAGELVRRGYVGASGRFARPDGAEGGDGPPDPEGRLERDGRGKLRYRLADGVWLTQNDLRQVQLAKGAIRAGIDLLLESLSLSAEDVDRVQIAGSFGYHIREQSLFHISLLPESFKGSVEFVGNTSKAGGEILLLNEGYRRMMEETARAVRVVELANDQNFEKVFVRSLRF